MPLCMRKYGKYPKFQMLDLQILHSYSSICIGFSYVDGLNLTQRFVTHNTIIHTILTYGKRTDGKSRRYPHSVKMNKIVQILLI